MLGGFSLSSPFGIVICVSCDLSFYVFWLFLFLCFLLFVGFLSSFSLPFFRFSVLFLFRCFLFTFSFFDSFSSFLLLFLGLSFVCFVLSSFFGFSFPPFSPLPLFLILLFVPVLVFSSLSSGPSFSASSRLSLPLAFPSLPPFVLSPLLSSSFVSVSFPSPLFFPSCWLFFLLVCPRCLFGGFLVFLFAFLAFVLRFLCLRFGWFW